MGKFYWNPSDLRNETIIFYNFERNTNFKIISSHTGSNQKESFLFRSPKSFKFDLGMKEDVWSLGAMIYLGLTGDLPFEGKDEE